MKDPNLDQLKADIADFCRKQDVKRSKSMEEAIDRALGLWEEEDIGTEDGEWI